MKYFLLPLALLLLSGCADSPPARGSAVEAAAAANARANEVAKEADAATIEAARLAAEADALEAAAKALPTEARIAAAVDARVKAASAMAVAKAFVGLVKLSATAATEASKVAEVEREKVAKAADLRALVQKCRWIGIMCAVLGAALGYMIGRFYNARTGIFTGGAIIVLGMFIIVLGPTITWLPYCVIGAVAIALVIWELANKRIVAVRTKMSQYVDVLTGKAKDDIVDARQQLIDAVTKSGIATKVENARSEWRKE